MWTFIRKLFGRKPEPTPSPLAPLSLSPDDPAARGARFLDRKFGGIHWAEKINTETLRMSHIERCILGQLFGRFKYGLQAYPELDSSGARTYGFMATDPLDVKQYEELERRWTEEVAWRVTELDQRTKPLLDLDRK